MRQLFHDFLGDLVELLFWIQLLLSVRILKALDGNQRGIEIKGRPSAVLAFVDCLVEGVLAVNFDRLEDPKVLGIPSEIQEASFELAGWNSQTGEPVEILTVLVWSHPLKPLKVKALVDLVFLIGLLCFVLGTLFVLEPEVGFQLSFLLHQSHFC